MSELLVSTRKGLFVWRQERGQWRLGRTAFLGNPVSIALWDARDGSVYAALNLGHFGVKLHRQDGENWTEVAVPTYPEKPPEEAELEQAAGRATPWSTQLIWSLEAGGKDEPGVLWAGTIPGGLFRSPDRGQSWTLNRPLWDRPERRKWFGGGYDHAGVHSIAVDPRDSRAVTIGVSCGGAWHTEDAGATWSTRSKGMFAEFMPPDLREDPAVQDPHRLVQCPDRPDSLWVQHHNGIFRSTDRGRNWTVIPTARPSVFGFAVAVHPHEPDTAWFVPAKKDEFRYPVDGKVVVSRTRDGGKSFDVLGDGLPSENAYHLVYRHGLDVDPSGEMLAIGSTTGGLWVSADQGDHWQTLSRDLPPIYAVCFANSSG